MKRILSVIRKSACAVFALGLIVCGIVRRARRRALAGGVVTAVYFHKPSRHVFVQAVDWLEQHGYTFISGRDVVDFVRGRATPPAGAVWLSFDDGCRELLTDVLPVVRSRHIPVTLFIPSSIVQGEGRFYWVQDPGRHSITAAELKEIAAYPEVAIGSHTATHAIVVRCTEEQLRRELVESKRDLELLTGAPVDVFSYPNGEYDEQAVRLLYETGYALAVTTESDLVRPGINNYLAPRFSVADDLYYPELIANLAGAWRPLIDPLKRAVRRLSRRPAAPMPAAAQRAKVGA